ncbi:MAG: D-2-hydroxyacid dehydrogenase [Flavobacteriales bacterium]|nr:D-2-hydroxyacid dehydrogenase [Flavobacteriales bacterium]
MKKVLANDGIDAAGKAILEKAGFTVITEKVAQDQLADYLFNEKVAVLLVRSATTARAELIDQCPDLKIIGRAGVGMDNIDVAYAREKGIKVLNTPGASSQSVAELVFSHLFTLSRKLHVANREMPEKGTTEFGGLKKTCSEGIELKGKTLGVIGFGRIGQATATMALGLGMNVLPYDPFVEKTVLEIDFFHTDDTFSIEYHTVPLEEVIAKSDFLTLHVPASKDGKPLIGEAELAKMKDGVILVNTARGGLIDEQALLDALNNGKVRGAGLDVFVGEPQPDKRLLNHPKISVTPHIGGSTAEAQERIGIELAEAVVAQF